MSDLIDRKAAIDALGEKPLAWTEGEYELGLQNQWQSDVDALKDIPSAEPERKSFHVIDKKTGQEADTWEIALNEDWAKHLCYCDMEGFAILEDGTLILADECGRFEFIQEEDRFEIVWEEVTDEDAG